MDITRRLIGTSAILKDAPGAVDIDLNGIIRRLILFDTYILKTIRFREFPSLIAAVGFDGTMQLLKSTAFEIECECAQIGQTGQAGFVSRAAKGVLPPLSYSLSGIDAADHEKYVHDCLQRLHKIRGLTHTQVAKLKRAIVYKMVRLPEGFASRIAAQATADVLKKQDLVWALAESPGNIQEEARKLLAWEDIQDEQEDLHLDDAQKRQLDENLKKARRDLKEGVWRTHKNLVLLGKDNQLRVVDLGLVHSSAADTMLTFIIERLYKDDDVEKHSASPNFLVRNWPPAFKEWSTKAVRDAFFASPLFPRLLRPESAKDTIARGLEAGLLGYVGKSPTGDYQPFMFGCSLNPQDVEISDDMFIVTRETAESYKKLKEKPPVLASLLISPATAQIQPGRKQAFVVTGVDQYGQPIPSGAVVCKATGGTIDNDGVFTAGQDEGSFSVTATADALKAISAVIVGDQPPPPPPPPKPPAQPGTLRWTGDVPPQKWMNFYTKVLSKFATGKGLRLTLSVEVSPEGGLSPQKIEQTKVALQELGLKSDVETG